MSQSSQYPECRHILPSGRKCHSPALRGKPLCYFHSRHRTLIDHNRYRQSSVALPPLEDRSAIQMAVNEVLSAMADSKIDRHAAGLYLFGLQIASQNLARASDLASPEAVNLYQDKGGDVLAAEEPPAIAIESAADSGGKPAADHFPLQLPHINTCDTHEYDREPPNSRPLTKKQKEHLKQIEIGLKTTQAAQEYYASVQAWKDAQEKAVADAGSPSPPLESNEG